MATSPIGDHAPSGLGIVAFPVGGPDTYHTWLPPGEPESHAPDQVHDDRQMFRSVTVVYPAGMSTGAVRSLGLENRIADAVCP
jgi:hypothetical protein